jgi:hypothetical protein
MVTVNSPRSVSTSMANSDSPKRIRNSLNRIEDVLLIVVQSFQARINTDCRRAASNALPTWFASRSAPSVSMVAPAK